MSCRKDAHWRATSCCPTSILMLSGGWSTFHKLHFGLSLIKWRWSVKTQPSDCSLLICRVRNVTPQTPGSRRNRPLLLPRKKPNEASLSAHSTFICAELTQTVFQCFLIYLTSCLRNKSREEAKLKDVSKANFQELYIYFWSHRYLNRCRNVSTILPVFNNTHGTYMQ